MIDSQGKGLPFPKGAYLKKVNGRTNFTQVTEVKLLPVAANWDTSLFALQLEYLPALTTDAVGQSITALTVTCTNDSSTRTVLYKRPDNTDPDVGSVFLDIFSGTIQFNPADANKTFSVTYYKKASLVDHNAMNRIWSGGPNYIVGDQPYHDFSDLQSCFTACLGGETVKLAKDIVTTGLTVTVAVRIDGNNKKITKSGSATSSRAINFSGDMICENVDFRSWSAAGDICLFASADVRAIISTNKAIGCTKLTNASTATTYSIVENNLPFSENVGQAVTNITNTVQNKLIKQYTANGSISILDPVFLDLADPTKCKKLTTPTDADIFIGFATNNAATGVTVNVCINGTMDGFSGLTANKTYYITKTGTLATIALGSRPLPAIYSSFSSNNPLLGSTGDSYHTYVGKAISTSEIKMTPKRQNNMTWIDGAANGLSMLSANTVGLGGTNNHNLFTDSVSGITPQNFDTSNTPWEIDLEIVLNLKALTATSSLPQITFTLQQYDSGTTNLRTIDASAFVPYPLSTTINREVAYKCTLKNFNPGAGRCILKVTMSAGSGSPSGTVDYTFYKIDLRFPRD